MGRHRDDLQGLRAIAVLLVVLSHAGVPHLKGGFVGVDVFFVLSGYLITGLLLSAARKGQLSLGEFYKRRIRRILPAATLTLVTTLVAAYALLNFVRARQVLTDGMWSAVFAANVHFAQAGTDYFAQGQPPSPLQHFWTLAVEEQFYLVWPALLIVILALRRGYGRGRHRLRLSHSAPNSRALQRLTVAAALITFASVAWSVREGGAASSYFSTASRAWELGLGALLAVAAGRIQLPARVRAAIGWAGLVAIVAAGVGYSSSTPFPGYAALLPTFGAAAVIASGLGGLANAGRALAVWPLRYIGDRSYALYLWHWPVLVIAADYEGHALSVATRLALVAGAFAVSIVTYRFYENPIRQRDWSGAASAFAVSASVAAVLLVAAVAATRIDQKITALANAAAGVAAAQAIQATPAIDTYAILPVMTPDANGGVLSPVADAVDQGNKGASIPAALNPPPDQLLNSEYQFPSGCNAHDGQTTSKVCQLGDAAASRLLVVFGDSHAQMWMPAILALAQKDGWKVIPLDKSGCTPGRWLGGGSECSTWYGWAVAQAQQLHPDVVLIGGAYAGSTGTEAQNASSGLDALTTTMRHTGAKVVLIEDVPPQTQQPVDCLLRSHASLADCSSQWTLDNQANEATTTDAAIASGGRSGARMIYTTGWFCSATVCPMVVGDTVTFMNLGHITGVYAQELAAPFRVAFNRALHQATQ